MISACINIQSNCKPWLRKVSMMILALLPILAWYEIPFPVGLGYTLILFLSTYIIVRNNFKISIMSEFKQFKTPEIIFIDDCDVQYNFRKLLQSLSYRRKVQFYLIRICLLVLFFLLMYGIQRLL